MIYFVKGEKGRPTIPPCPKVLLYKIKIKDKIITITIIKEYSELITRCWDTNPNNRPSASELVAIITSIINSLSHSPKAAPIPPAKSIASYHFIITLPNIVFYLELFFTINKQLLLSHVDPSCIEVLSNPPPFPSLSQSPPHIPKSITIVKIMAKGANPVATGKPYDIELFERL